MLIMNLNNYFFVYIIMQVLDKTNAFLKPKMLDTKYQFFICI